MQLNLTGKSFEEVVKELGMPSSTTEARLFLGVIAEGSYTESDPFDTEMYGKSIKYMLPGRSGIYYTFTCKLDNGNNLAIYAKGLEMRSAKSKFIQDSYESAYKELGI